VITERSHSVGTRVAYPRVRVSEMQRARLLSAAVVTFDELGYARATVAHITARARVSRRTFYDLFAGREECLLAIVNDAVERVVTEFESECVGVGSWCGRVRVGLGVVLAFLDREPVLARVCVVQSARGSQRVLEAREEILARVAGLFDEGRGEGVRAAQTPPLTAEGLAGAVLAIVYKRLLKGDGDQLEGLLNELMGMIVLPYLGPAAARRECTRAIPVTPRTSVMPVAVGRGVGGDPLREVPMRLTYRTARVLQATASNPGGSNRLIGEQADIHDQGQISKLLGRLERLGLLRNTGNGHAKGEANAWSLTGLGERVTQQLSLNTEQGQSEQQSTHLEGSW